MSDLRMRDLERVSGLPRSTIHFYLRQGLLTPGRKTARNAALYDQGHVARLSVLRRLREPPLGPLPLPLVRRVLELVDQGVELEMAVSLERAVLGGAGGSEETDIAGGYDLETLAARAGAPRRVVEEMLEVGLLVPPPGETPRFDAADLRMVRLCHGLIRETGLPLAAGRRISATIRELSAYEMALRNRAVENQPVDRAADLTRRIQEGVNAIHHYLFYRWRLHDIAALGGGLLPASEGR